MRDVFEHRELADQIGQRARCDIREGYGEAAVAAQIEQRLRAIAGRDTLPALRREMRRFHGAYAALIAAVRSSVESSTPPGSRILVVSRGDAELVDFSERFGSHFPQGNDGEYVGYHPPDSEWAVAHLQELQEAGAEYILLPGTARWWMDYYTGFRRHLERACQLVSEDDYGVLYQLGAAGSSHSRIRSRRADPP